MNLVFGGKRGATFVLVNSWLQFFVINVDLPLKESGSSHMDSFL